MVIYTNGKTPKKKTSNSQKKYVIIDEGKFNYYIVQKGDTLWDISGKVGISLDQLKKMNQNLNARDLKVGQKIKIGSKG